MTCGMDEQPESAHVHAIATPATTAMIIFPVRSTRSLLGRSPAGRRRSCERRAWVRSTRARSARSPREPPSSTTAPAKPTPNQLPAKGAIGTGFQFLETLTGASPALASKLPQALAGKSDPSTTGQLLAGAGQGLGALAAGIGKAISEPSSPAGLDASASGQVATEQQYAQFAQKYVQDQNSTQPLFSDGPTLDASVAEAQDEIGSGGDPAYQDTTEDEESAAFDAIAESDLS